MATEYELDRNSFTLTWRIFNYKFFLQDFSYWICSPWFMLDTSDSCKRRLLLSPGEGLKNEFIGLTICNKRISNISEEITLDYCFSVSSDHSSFPPFEISNSHEFLDDLSRPCVYVPKDKIFKQEADRFIPPDVLIVQSQIWKLEGSLTEGVECTMITKAEVETVSFVGMVENFSDLTSCKKKAIRIKHASFEASQFSLNINISNGGMILIEVIPWIYENIEYCKCKLKLLDTEGNETECGYDEFLFLNTKPESTWKIPLQFSMNKLIELQKQYLPTNCLYLQCEIAFSTRKYKSKILKTKYAVNLSKSIGRTFSRVQSNTEAINRGKLPSTVQDDLVLLLSKETLTDTKIQTATETFLVHKLVLSVRSQVFSDLIRSMNECVHIEDLDADTVRQLLLFMYTDRLENLDLESAKKLYFAAVKYTVLILKHKCSRFLKKNISSSNCCNILLLAEKHGDFDLKRAAQEYMAVHNEEVFDSCQWKDLEKTNMTLAFETLRYMYKEKRKNSFNAYALLPL